MLSLNSRQKSIAAVVGATLLTILVAHNPLSGYLFTEVERIGFSSFQREWRFDQAGCDEKTRQEWQRTVDLAESKTTYEEKWSTLGSGKHPEISKRCVRSTTTTAPSTFEPEPFWRWVSQGALLPIAAPMEHLLYALLMVGLWGGVALFAFRSGSKPT